MLISINLVLMAFLEFHATIMLHIVDRKRYFRRSIAGSPPLPGVAK